MNDRFKKFEEITRRTPPQSGPDEREYFKRHPFEQNGIHEALPPKVKELFDDGHYSEAAFEAFKFVVQTVKTLSGDTRDGKALMLNALGIKNPLIPLNHLANQSETDEQEGYSFLFAGSILAIRNPRAHEHSIDDNPDKCLDHLILASILLRRLEEAGYSV
jgi:uncharacterized protein (TIGR02391 family)